MKCTLYYIIPWANFYVCFPSANLVYILDKFQAVVAPKKQIYMYEKLPYLRMLYKHLEF